MGMDAIIACQCASMRPGIRTLPPQSTTRQPGARGLSAGSTALMAPPSITTRKPSRSASDLPSKSRRLENAIGVAEAEEENVAVLPEPAANTPSAVPTLAMTERLENFRARWAFSRAKAGV
jgi:hypothetical protein